MQVCVLGATGFIGGAVARAAVQRGWHVRALRRRPNATGALEELADEIEWIPGALEDDDALLKAMHGCDAVFHAAGYYPAGYATMQEHLARAAAQTQQVLTVFGRSDAGRLVYTSSLTTIGPPGEPGRLADERDVYPPGSERTSPYFECKALMEALVLGAAVHGLNTVAVNPTMTFGPGDVKAFTGRAIILAAKGVLFFSLPGELNFTDVRDVAAGQLAAAEALPTGERVILGGHNLPVPQAFQLLNAVAGRRPPLFTVPRAVVEGIGRILFRLPVFMLQDHMTTLHRWQPLNTAKMETLLGIQPRPFETTIADALAWYRRRNYL
jgi:dihydroflavonol-4-reductase